MDEVTTTAPGGLEIITKGGRWRWDVPKRPIDGGRSEDAGGTVLTESGVDWEEQPARAATMTNRQGETGFVFTRTR